MVARTRVRPVEFLHQVVLLSGSGCCLVVDTAVALSFGRAVARCAPCEFVLAICNDVGNHSPRQRTTVADIDIG